MRRHRGREALRRDVLLAVVEDPDFKADLRGEAGRRLADVAAADQEEGDARQRREVGDAVLSRGPRTGRNGSDGAESVGDRSASRRPTRGASGPPAGRRRRRRDSGRRCTGRRVGDDDGLGKAAALSPRNRADGDSRAPLRTGGQRVQQDRHAAAADQAVVPAVDVVKVKSPHFRTAAGVQRLERPLLHFRLDASAAERADLAAVRKDEHGGARPSAASSRASRPRRSRRTAGADPGRR